MYLMMLLQVQVSGTGTVRVLSSFLTCDEDARGKVVQGVKGGMIPHLAIPQQNQRDNWGHRQELCFFHPGTQMATSKLLKKSNKIMG